MKTKLSSLSVSVLLGLTAAPARPARACGIPLGALAKPALSTNQVISGTEREPTLRVHEWGTFTSLQGSDGAPLKWNPLESSKLPGFVYDWMHPGDGRRPAGMLALGQKGALVTLQRMETPVVYFYTAKETKVDLTVRFPNGGITEWYPQAADVDPSEYPVSPIVTSLDSGLHQSGVASTFKLESVFPPRKQKESLIQWTDLKIIPLSGKSEPTPPLPTDPSGSHYFSARETDSALVELPRWVGTNTSIEREKFLFYRGVGNFVAPLRVEMSAEGTVLVSNTGIETLAHLFVLGIRDNHGSFVSVDRLKPGERKAVGLVSEQRKESLEVLCSELQADMKRALTSEGLFEREAAAMVKTWRDSWFAEPGVRVLYVLPRAWTDQTLPMTLEPQPKELVRVMVGRAELISTQTESDLARELAHAKEDQAVATSEFRKSVAELGRFAEPAFNRALARADLQPNDQDRLRGWFYQVRNNALP